MDHSHPLWCRRVLSVCFCYLLAASTAGPMVGPSVLPSRPTGARQTTAELLASLLAPSRRDTTAVASETLPVLTGTITGSGHRLALLESNGEDSLIEVGDRLGALRLVEVSNHEAVLEQPSGERVVLQLSAPARTLVARGAEPPSAVERKRLVYLLDHASGVNLSAVRNGYQVTFQAGSENPLRSLGLASGDVILSLQDRALRGPEDLQWALSELRNGSNDVAFRIERDGSVKSFSVELTD